MKSQVPRLKDVIRRAIIIAYNEDTTALERFFEQNSTECTRQVFNYNEKQRLFLAIVRCFINHHMAWQRVSETDGWTLIVEADFVPVNNMMSEKVFWPWQEKNTFGYLYHNSPRIIALEGSFIRAHSAGAVAYVINRHVARILLDFFIDEEQKRDFEKYFTFDVHLQWYCMGRGQKAYISKKQLGEHGGLVSWGHIDNKIPRLGHHRADRLYGRLAFKPIYSKGLISFVRERAFGYGIGLARLAKLRWTTDTSEHRWNAREKIAAYRVVCERLFLRSSNLQRA